MKIRHEIVFCNPLTIHFRPQEHGHGYTLFAPIGPFQEQEIPAPMNPSIVITDSQKFSIGPFDMVDAKGFKIGPATGVTPSTGDTTVLTGADNGDGTLEFSGGIPGQTQAICTDSNGKMFVVDVTVTAGAESGISGTVGAPTEQ